MFSDSVLSSSQGCFLIIDLFLSCLSLGRSLFSDSVDFSCSKGFFFFFFLNSSEGFFVGILIPCFSSFWFCSF